MLATVLNANWTHAELLSLLPTYYYYSELRKLLQGSIVFHRPAQRTMQLKAKTQLAVDLVAIILDAVSTKMKCRSIPSIQWRW